MYLFVSYKDNLTFLYIVCLFSSGLSKMRAVTDQQELLTNLQEKFAQRLATHLNNMFLQQVT